MTTRAAFEAWAHGKEKRPGLKRGNMMELLCEAAFEAGVAYERARCKLVVQRRQYRNGHHTHEGATMGHYDIQMIADIESGFDPQAIRARSKE